MAAYWISRCIVYDHSEYKKYTDLVPSIIESHGGRVLARGGHFQIMEGPEAFHRFVVIEFPPLEAGVNCFQSDEYTSAARPEERRCGKECVSTVRSRWSPIT